jgi:hypothetical protein
MQAHYDVVKLTFRPNGVAAALPRIERALASGTNAGALRAVFVAEIGELNQVLIVHAIDAPGAPLAMRDARQRRGDLFGVADEVVGASASTFASFPFVPAIEAGRYGPVYEVREYAIKSGSLPALLAAWEPALPARIAMSPIVTAAYALDGEQPRMMHIWPYVSLNDRARLRSEAIAKGIWPPKGSADYLAAMRSTIYLPAPFSPLQ